MSVVVVLIDVGSFAVIKRGWTYPTKPVHPSSESLDSESCISPYVKYWRPSESRIKQAILENDLRLLRLWARHAVDPPDCATVRHALLIGKMGAWEAYSLFRSEESRDKKAYSNMLLFAMKGACSHGKLDLVQQLVKDPRMTDYQREMAIETSLCHHHHHIVRFLRSLR